MIRKFLITLTAVLSLSANADYVVMEVDSSIRSGTYRCESVQSCVLRVRNAEERGAMQYCNSVIIKSNGRVVWGRNYYPTTRQQYLRR